MRPFSSGVGLAVCLPVLSFVRPLACRSSPDRGGSGVQIPCDDPAYRRVLVGLVGMVSVVTVLVPGGYLSPLVATIVPSVAAAPMGCAMGDMTEMQMPMPADCAAP